MPAPIVTPKDGKRVRAEAPWELYGKGEGEAQLWNKKMNTSQEKHSPNHPKSKDLKE